MRITESGVVLVVCQVRGGECGGVVFVGSVCGTVCLCVKCRRGRGCSEAACAGSEC